MTAKRLAELDRAAPFAGQLINAGFVPMPWHSGPTLTELIADEFRKVIAEEREACAQVADERGWEGKGRRCDSYVEGSRDMADEIAAAIRARGTST